MKGLTPLLNKEIKEQLRTHRLLIVGGVFLCFGLMAPLLLYFMPDILKMAGMFIAPLTLISATLVVMAKNLAGMILCDLIGSLFGTGIIVKIIGTVAGLA